MECAGEDSESEFELAQILGIIDVVDNRNDTGTFLLSIYMLEN